VSNKRWRKLLIALWHEEADRRRVFPIDLESGCAATLCGKALPYRRGYALILFPWFEAQPRTKELKGTSTRRKGKAFPHGRRQSRVSKDADGLF